MMAAYRFRIVIERSEFRLPIADGVAVAIARGLGHAQQLGGADLGVHLAAASRVCGRYRMAEMHAPTWAAILIVGRMAEVGSFHPFLCERDVRLNEL